jgi:hypothetical protein
MIHAKQIFQNMIQYELKESYLRRESVALLFLFPFIKNTSRKFFRSQFIRKLHELKEKLRDKNNFMAQPTLAKEVKCAKIKSYALCSLSFLLYMTGLV